MKLDPVPVEKPRALARQLPSSRPQQLFIMEVWCPRHGLQRADGVTTSGEVVLTCELRSCGCSGASFYRHELRGTIPTELPDGVGRALHALRVKRFDAWLTVLGEGDPSGEEA